MAAHYYDEINYKFQTTFSGNGLVIPAAFEDVIRTNARHTYMYTRVIVLSGSYFFFLRTRQSRGVIVPDIIQVVSDDPTEIASNEQRAYNIRYVT